MSEHREAIEHLMKQYSFAKAHRGEAVAAPYKAAADALERLGQDDAPALAERVRRLEAEREKWIDWAITSRPYCEYLPGAGNEFRIRSNEGLVYKTHEAAVAALLRIVGITAALAAAGGGE